MHFDEQIIRFKADYLESNLEDSYHANIEAPLFQSMVGGKKVPL